MVAHTHNVVHAAENLYISQPAVSAALKKFQNELGFSLFIKYKRNLVLTEEGKKILEFADKIFSIEKDIDSYIHMTREKASTSIQLGLVTLYERSLATDILDKIRVIDSSITVSIHSGNSKLLLEKILNNEIDIAIAGDIKSYLELNKFFYKKHQIFLVVPKGHRLFRHKTFLPEDIQDESIVMKELGSAVRNRVSLYLEEYHININVFSELSNFDSILDIILKNNCISFFPDDIVSHLIQDKSLFHVLSPSDSPLYFSTYLYTRRLASYPMNMQPIIKKITDTLKKSEA